MDDLYIFPRLARHFRQSYTAGMCVTGRRCLPPSASTLGTAVPEEMVDQRRGFTAAERNTLNYDSKVLAVSTWRLDTDRRLSVDHSKLALVPVDQSGSPVDDGLRSTCSCDQRVHFRRGTDRKRCPRCSRAPTVDDLRLDDERRGRFRTLYLGSEFISPAKSLPVTPAQRRAESTTARRSTRSLAGTTSPVAEGLRTRRSRSSQSQPRDKVVPSGEDGGGVEDAADKCDECEQLLAERYGGFDSFIELINSRKIPADWVSE